MERYNFEREQWMGMTVNPLPTQKTLERHKVKVREELLSYFFEEKLHTIFTEQEIIEMKIRFLKNYEVLLSNADFANSFVSSEWYYDFQVKTDVGLDPVSNTHLDVYKRQMQQDAMESDDREGVITEYLELSLIHI